MEVGNVILNHEYVDMWDSRVLVLGNYPDIYMDGMKEIKKEWSQSF
jgi:hypothetical protein